MPFRAQRPYFAEIVTHLKFVHVACARTESGSVYIHTYAEVVAMFFLLLFIVGEAEGQCYGGGIFVAGQGGTVVVVGAENGLLENEISTCGKQGRAFAKIQRTETLGFEPEVGRYHHFVCRAAQVGERNDGAAVQGDACGHFLSGLVKRVIGAFTEQTGQVLQRNAEVGTEAF